jgi:hypothetical protein
MRSVLRRLLVLFIAPALSIAMPQSGHSAEAPEPAASLSTELAVRVPIVPVDRAAAEADIAAPIPADTVEIPVLRTLKVSLGGWTYLNTTTCKVISLGKYTIKSKPHDGKLNFAKGTGVANSGPCEGVELEFEFAYYTWTSAVKTAKQDYFEIVWSANSKKCTSNCTEIEDFLAVLGPRILQYNPETASYGDVTGTRQTVAVGQQILIYGEPYAKGETAGWTVPGKTIGGYTASSTSYSTGAVIPSNFTTNGTLFYWTNAGKSRTALFKVKYPNGVSASASSVFNVVAPTDAKVGIKRGKVALLDSDVLSFGNPSTTQGVTLSATVTEPTAVSGSLQWVQLQTTDDLELHSNGAKQSCTYGLGLDGGFPFASGNDLAQSPSITLSATNTPERFSGAYATYLMWSPNVPESIAIPLGVVRWNWSGAAEYNATKAIWKLTASADKIQAFQLSAVFPTWTTLVSTGVLTCK